MLCFDGDYTNFTNTLLVTTINPSSFLYAQPQFL